MATIEKNKEEDILNKLEKLQKRMKKEQEQRTEDIKIIYQAMNDIAVLRHANLVANMQNGAMSKRKSLISK